MGKSVYSLVLTDEVVRAVDELAYGMNTSRSNLIDMILAERVSFTTPEMRMREVFSLMEQLLGGRFLPSQQGSVMAVKTPLKFKYKPTVKYSVELLSENSGRLKVTLRTQSEELTRLAEQFFLLRREIEVRYISQIFGQSFFCQISPKCFLRDFHSGGEVNERQLAEGICAYIRSFDKSMSLFFDNHADRRTAASLCEEEYVGYLKSGTAVI